MVSREAAFLYNNLILVGIAFSVLWGTLFPILSEAVRGTKITVGPPFFNAVNVPLGLLLLALTGVGPLIAWRRASVSNLKRQFTVPVAGAIIACGLLLAAGMRDFYAIVTYTLAAFVATTIGQEFYKGVGARRSMYGENGIAAFFRLVGRNRRRYGGYIVHAGIVIIFAAFAGLAFKKEYDLTMRAGDSRTVADPWGRQWTFVSQGVSRFDVLNREVTSVSLATQRDGAKMGLITSEKRQYFSGTDPNTRVPTFQPSTEVGILGSFQQDVYVTLAGVVGEGTSELRVTFNPLVRWVWLGGMLMAVGGLIVMWPQAERRRRQSGYVTAVRPEHVPEVTT
jgi:cytochrome c-type biogenesis protein CcmF